MATIVSIGKNIGSFEMNDLSWIAFKTEIFLLFREAYFYGDGIGHVDKKKYGVSAEYSYTIIGEVKDKDEFETKIIDLATKYMQDSIAVTYGETKLVEGKK